MELYFRKFGEGLPVIVLHGVFGSSDNLTLVAKKMAESFEVFLLDQRNHGHSPHSDEFNYGVLTSDLLEFIERHKIENPIIMGHSMGGKVAMNFALLYPERLSKLVVVDISPRYYAVHHQSILQALSTDVSAFASRAHAEQVLIDFLPAFSTRQFIMKNLVRKEGGGFAWKINTKSLSQNIEQVGAAIVSQTSFPKPVLVVKGEKSDYIQASDELDFQKLFPNYSLAVVKNSGHWVHAEAPEGFLEAVMPFLIGQTD